MDGRMTKLGIGGVSELAACGEFKAQHAFGAEGELIFRRFSIDEETGAARSSRSGFCANTIALFADDEKQRKVTRAGSEQRFGGGNHGSEDALGVARTAAMDVGAVFA